MSRAFHLCGSLCILLATAVSPSFGEVAHLVRDISPGTDESTTGAISSQISQLTAFGDHVAFVTRPSAGGEEPVARGVEVWVADAATGRAAPLGDFCPEACGGASIIATIGGKLFFTTHGSWARLWATDGSAAGTELLLGADRRAEPELQAPGQAAALSRGLVFPVTDFSRYSLWASDGTSAGTVQLAVVGNYPYARPTNVVVMGDRAFFHVYDIAAQSARLWSTDGTSAGTHEVPGLAEGSLEAATATHLFLVTQSAGAASLWATDGTSAAQRVASFRAYAPFGRDWMKAFGSHLYFLAEDDRAGGVQLWRSDGTVRGTVRITDFSPQDAFSTWDEDRDELEILGGRLVLVARDKQNVSRLWTSTGSPSTTKELPLPCASPPCTVQPYGLRRLGDRLYFIGSSAQGTKLWTTDGTAAGTRPVVDLCPSFCLANYAGAGVVGTQLYLAVGAPDYELWATDGTAAGTRRLTRFTNDQPFQSFRPELVGAGGRVWFAADEPPYGAELWSSDGTAESAELAADVDRGAVGSHPAPLVAVGERVLFSACDGESRELWASAGTEPTTTPLTDEDRPCRRFGFLDGTVATGGRAYFWTFDFAGATLWSADGTAAGLSSLVTVAAQSGGGQPPIPPPLLAVAGGVAFVAQSRDGGPIRLWRSDGTPAGTRSLVDLPRDAERFWADGSDVYFIADGTSPGFTGAQLWRADLAAETLHELTHFNSFSSFPAAQPLFAKLGSEVYFQVDVFDIALWKTDGTPAGTVPAFELPSNAGFAVFGLASLGGALYLHTRDNSRTYQLWRSDGTTAGSQRLLSVTTRDGVDDESSPELALVGDRVVFAGEDAEHGIEPWSTDGTPAGTQLLRDVLVGPAGSSPADLTVAGGRLYFVATDRRHGRELWSTDGTAAGTRLVHDIAPDALSSNPGELTVAGSSLYFAADDGLTGRELWVLPLAGPGCATTDLTLCLGGRFAVEAVWRDSAGNSGRGHAAALTRDTGTFWFFASSNVEVILKVLDGSGVNGHGWVFYGALSDVEYTLTITDTQTGAVRRYMNPQGRLASVGDTEAFGPRGSSAARSETRVVAEASPPAIVTERRDLTAKALCSPSATRLCLGGGRFAVEVAWRDFAGNTGVGTGTALSADTGDFWFFNADNVELVVKILDGRPLNGKFWLFYGALSSVQYTLTVTDTETGAVHTYQNPSGRLASVADTSAF